MEEVVDSIKQKFGNLQKFAKSCGETKRVVYMLCDTKEKKVDERKYSHKLASGDREEIVHTNSKVCKFRIFKETLKT